MVATVITRLTHAGTWGSTTRTVTTTIIVVTCWESGTSSYVSSVTTTTRPSRSGNRGLSMCTLDHHPPGQEYGDLPYVYVVTTSRPTGLIGVRGPITVTHHHRRLCLGRTLGTYYVHPRLGGGGRIPVMCPPDKGSEGHFRVRHVPPGRSLSSPQRQSPSPGPRPS